MSGQNLIWLDGIRTLSLPLPDRGLDFGDGVFETFLVHEGNPLFPEYHLARLSLGLQALGIPAVLDNIESQLAIATGATENTGRWAVLRLSILRGPGPRGYGTGRSSTPRILINVSNMERDCAVIDEGAVLCIADIFLSTQPVLARIKHLNRLEQIIAANQAQSEGTDEAVLLDQAGNITSVIAGNIFLVYKGELLTPALVDCGVAGTRRQLIIERWAPDIGMRVRETRLSLADLHRAEEVFFSNSLKTVRPIAKIGNQNWENQDVCEALFQRFLEDI